MKPPDGEFLRSGLTVTLRAPQPLPCEHLNPYFASTSTVTLRVPQPVSGEQEGTREAHGVVREAEGCCAEVRGVMREAEGCCAEAHGVMWEAEGPT